MGDRDPRAKREYVLQQRDGEHRERQDDEEDAGQLHDGDEDVHHRGLSRRVRPKPGRGVRLDDGSEKRRDESRSPSYTRSVLVADGVQEPRPEQHER